MKKLILVVAVAITVFAGVAVNSPADTVVGAPEPSPNKMATSFATSARWVHPSHRRGRELTPMKMVTKWSCR